MENEKKRGEKKKKDERNGKRKRRGEGGRIICLVREGVTIECSMREQSGRAHSGSSTLEYTRLCYPPTCDHTS